MHSVRSLLSALIAALFAGVAPQSHAATDPDMFSGQIDPNTGQVFIEQHSIKLLETEFVFWRGEWEWLGPAVQATAADDERSFHVAGRNAEAGLDIAGQVRIDSEGEDLTTIRMQLKIEELPGGALDSYGGIVFRVNPIDPVLSGFEATPVINEKKTGWSLDLGAGRAPLAVNFDRPLERLEFEQGNSREIRAYLLEPNDRRDVADIGIDIVFPGKMNRAPSQRLSTAVGTWPVSELHWNRSPVDLSFLNTPEKPAGKRGFVRADGERLVFADGTQARFWGTNIAAYSLFQVISPNTVQAQAKRLSRLGFNLVRIHHHDSTWVNPNVFGLNPEQTHELSAQQMDKIHWWIKCLKDEGIYVWIDLHVGREVTRADNTEAFDEMAGGGKRGGLQGFLFVNPSLQERFAEFASDYLSSKSPYTGLALKDDPAVIGVLITNENDITGHFIHLMLPPERMPWHAQRYLELAETSKAAKGVDRGALLRPWEHGQVRIVLGDIERRFFDDMTHRLRDLGVKVPIVTTNYWGNLPVSSLPSLATGDMMDVHSYAQPNEVQYNPRFRAGALSWIGAGAVAGKPLTVSEWNPAEPYPVFDRFVFPLHIAAIARFQDWPALMQYPYAQQPFLGDPNTGDWSAYNDPAMLATLPAGALLYRAGHVREGTRTTLLQLPLDALAEKQTDPGTSRALRTLVERTKMRIGLPAVPGLDWHQETAAPSDATVVTDVNFDAVGSGTTRVCSDTEEICRDWEAGVLTIDTPRSQIAAGWIGGEVIETGDVTFKVNEANAAVAVQSLGDQPIAQADELMISMTAQVLPLRLGAGPHRSEPITGEIAIRARAGLNLYRLDLDGKPLLTETTYQDGRYVIKLRTEDQGHWWVLR